MAGDRPSEYGEAWAYESIVGALPGVDISARAAIAVQILAFEVGVVVLGLLYGLSERAMVAGTAAVLVSAAGSAAMLRLGARIRALPAPEPYRRLLLGSSVEVVLGVLAFVALVTHLFVFDPANSERPLVEALFGPDPPFLVVYLALLVLWDVTYRIGASWWACVVAVWRSYRYSFDPATARAFQRVDGLAMAFGAVQALLVPFVLDRPVLLAALVGHLSAVTVATALSVGLLELRVRGEDGILTPT
ncbi:hypothetical protein BRD00_08985 [Halobacteriales archaeon QS_8_69_26]|nr:MAG: hypothetical protein BRD00_08985 [Halobacteriales archaeon QS_8_69_26]